MNGKCVYTSAITRGPNGTLARVSASPQERQSLTNGIMKRQDILLIPIHTFFKHAEHRDLLEGILVTSTYKVSLRIIDWFVTNYAKKYNIVIEKGENGKPIRGESPSVIRNDNRAFLVYIEYKSQLKAYSKKQFDPFCRRSRINYEYAPGKTFETTIGQLNFFRWAIENGVIHYIIDNYDDIEKDMNNTLKGSRPDPSSLKSSSSSLDMSSSMDSGESRKGSKKKSTITATKSVHKHNVKIIVSFD
jgi:hypothetical protein